jgi:phosphoribosylanthranilate isomerase
VVRVKICGITNPSDALWAAENGAAAIGFVFAKSPRQVSPEKAASIRRELPPFVSVVGIFVDPEPQEALRIYDRVGLDYVQYYGENEARFLLETNITNKFIRVVSVETEADLAAIEHSSAALILLDTKVKGLAGGTGKTFDWTLAAKAKKYGRKIILSGGLNPDNVAAAIAVATPDAVDVSSGVEASPGKKDREKVRDFIRRAKSYVA